MANKTVGDVADYLDGQIKHAGRTKPAIVGHSFGGLLAEILAGRGLSRASVAISPAPFRGVLPLPISSLRAVSPVLTNPANAHRAVPLTYEQFRYSFANAVDEDQAKRLYEEFAVPAPGAPLFEAAVANFNPWTSGQGEQQEPGSRPDADHLRRPGPHRAVGDLQRLIQEAEPQRGRHRDHQDSTARDMP